MNFIRKESIQIKRKGEIDRFLLDYKKPVTMRYLFPIELYLMFCV